MNRQTLLKNSLFTGTILLTLTGIVSRCIGFFYKIFLSRTMGAEALGIFQLIFPLFVFALSISCGGIQTAISRFTAASEHKKEARMYLYTGMGLSLMLSVLCGAVIYLQADVFSRYLLEEPRCEGLLRIMALAIPFAAVHNCINGYYYGLKKAAIPAACQLLEQIIRVCGVYAIYLILTEQGRPITAATAVWGLFIGEFASALFSLTMLRFQKASGNPIRTFHQLCTMAFPFTVNRVCLSLAQSLEVILIPLRLKDFGYSTSDALSVYGILTGMVMSTIMLPAVLSNSLSVMLLPEIARAQASKQERQICRIIQKTVELSLILGLLCTFGFLLCGTFIGRQLFHNHLAGVYLKNLCWICPFLFLSSTLCSILQGLGKPKTVLAINLCGSSIRIGFIFVLIPVIGMRGYLYGMLISQISVSALAYHNLKKAFFKRSMAS